MTGCFLSRARRRFDTSASKRRRHTRTHTGCPHKERYKLWTIWNIAGDTVTVWAARVLKRIQARQNVGLQSEGQSRSRAALRDQLRVDGYRFKNAIKTSLSARRVCICFERWDSASNRFAEPQQLVRRKVWYVRGLLGCCDIAPSVCSCFSIPTSSTRFSGWGGGFFMVVVRLYHSEVWIGKVGL